MSLATRFYESFQLRNPKGMAECYHEQIVFEDPAFGVLKGNEAAAMWAMLCNQAKDLKITFQILEETSSGSKVKWIADYTFSKTGRKVHNIIEATMVYQAGKIIQHTDHFDLKKWAKQAMGWKGVLLGGTDFFKRKLQAQTRKLLERYISRN
jgi:ketosteroid isomerase-like protein